MSDSAEQVRRTVREAYAAVVEAPQAACCGPSTGAATGAGCCGPAPASGVEFSARFGYSAAEMAIVPEGSNLGLGCGNPQAIADMKAGEVVVDLGSGAGFDCFLAARQVGPSGRVIGVDMTHEMLARARENAATAGLAHVEFRLGEIEHLPIADKSADVIISNCVVNLSPDKPQVLREAFRVLRPGGRIALSDVVRTADFPAAFANDAALLCGCVTGAASVDELERWLAEAGFIRIWIDVKEESREVIKDWAPGKGVENHVASAIIQAVRPGGCGCGGGTC